MYYLARTNGYPMLSSMLFNVKLNVIQRYQYEAEMIFIVNLINQNTNLTYWLNFMTYGWTPCQLKKSVTFLFLEIQHTTEIFAPGIIKLWEIKIYEMRRKVTFCLSIM